MSNGWARGGSGDLSAPLSGSVYFGSQQIAPLSSNHKPHKHQPPWKCQDS